MSFWATLWKVVFIVGSVVFTGMAVWVTIGGVRDIKRLFAKIEESHKQTPDAD